MGVKTNLTIKTNEANVGKLTLHTKNDLTLTRAKQEIKKLNVPEKSELGITLVKQMLVGNAPRTKQELFDCIYAFWGVYIPWARTEEPSDLHPWCSPFDWIWNVYSGKWVKSFAYANRSGGKTDGLSKLAYLFNTFKPYNEVVHVGGTKKQAQVASKYLRNMNNDPALSTVFKKNDVGIYAARWKNNSTWTIETGTMKGVSGQHCEVLSLDEVMFMEIDAINQTFGATISTKTGEPATWLAGSTNQRAYGGVQMILDTAKQKNIEVAKWSIFEIMQPCVTCEAEDKEPYGNEDARCNVCPLYKECLGIRAKKSRGWLSLRDAQAFVRSFDSPDSPEAQTQAFCKKPSTTGLVLSNYEHEPKALGGNDCSITYDYDHVLPFYVGYDPAEGKKSVLLFFHYWNGNVFIFDEIIRESCPTASAAKAEFYQYCKEKGYADPEAVIVDPRKTDAVWDWRNGTLGGEGILHFYNAVTPAIAEKEGGQEIVAGIEELRKKICDGAKVRRLYANPDQCPKLKAAIKNHHYNLDGNNQVTGRLPNQAYKDECDVLRYCVRFVNTVLDRGGRGDLEVW
jgi:hypothetical protein